MKCNVVVVLIECLISNAIQRLYAAMQHSCLVFRPTFFQPLIRNLIINSRKYSRLIPITTC